jgi:hypothetical protein
MARDILHAVGHKKNGHVPFRAHPFDDIEHLIPAARIKPAVGSSRMSTSGFIARTPAIAARRFWPPDSSEGRTGTKLLRHAGLTQRLGRSPYALFFFKSLVFRSEADVREYIRSQRADAPGTERPVRHGTAEFSGRIRPPTHPVRETARGPPSDGAAR